MSPTTVLARKAVLRLYFPLLVLFTCFAGLHLQRYPDMIFSSDPEGYYMYIAAPFFSGGFDQYKPGSPVYTPFEGTNRYFSKYTYGTALLEAPFVFAAHFVYVVKEGHHNTHGRLREHGFGVLAAYIFYSLFSLWILRRFLEKRFNPVWVMVAILGLFLGTNWLFYTVKEPGNSHIASLFIITCWMVFVPVLFRQPSSKNFALAGFIFGLTSLIRPTNAVAILYLLFAEMSGPNGGNWKDRRDFLVKHWKLVPISAAIVLLVWSPQMWYWHSITGNWLYYSYDEEGFIYWQSPKILNVLFDVQNGLFVYAPILFMPAIGLVYGIWLKRREAMGISAILAILTYLFASWHTWSFGGAYGHRCYVEWLGFLGIPFCWFLQELIAPSVRARWVVSGLTLALIYLSIGLSYLYQWPWEHPHWTWGRLQETICGLFNF
ncbi:MAG TPA: hypothetical protein VK168_06255 [Saprospiraceae bacterium]|nr:hypothetical protein [Saprospiraceae bacterium]